MLTAPDRYLEPPEPREPSDYAPCIHCHYFADEHLSGACVDIDPDEWDTWPTYEADPNYDTSEDPDPLLEVDA